ncbi:hypothetical protein Rsub_10373 [Raphidocelis subcapitata]|uniref:Kazal-like domain-containing protein n=1 Tax=Raphidocelis subcapitata TaxID=307507 RepID=A0A2V0PHR7_9CHLO|nr:hypothetical protein Rsub_10373 [Raphidocelis subcapitata]|eukprot:GBF97450.1 hypothetical protein Rsub_10373 [Raphidocelis subcapitata]
MARSCCRALRASGLLVGALVFAATFVALAQPAAAQQPRDCAAGCALDSAPVCGADRVTYMNACLADCAGGEVAHPGPCAPPGAPAAASGGGGGGVSAAAAAGVASWEHPIARLFADPAADDMKSAGAVTGGGDATVTAADMSRFASEGFVLAGAARTVDASALATVKPEDSQDGMALAAARASDAPIELFDVRVVPDSGLMYVRRTPLTGAAAALLSGPSELSTPGLPAPAAAAPPSAAPNGAAGAGRGAGELDGAPAPSPTPGAATGPKAVKQRGIRPSQWREVTALSPYPLTAVGFIESRLSATRGAKCSGALIGRHAVATAGHCVYSRGTRAFIRGSKFTPHHYYLRKEAVAPFGSSEMAYYAVQSGWVNGWPEASAYQSDVAVIVLNDDLGSRAGTLGFKYSPAGFEGRLYAAGYPGQSVTNGRFFGLRGACVVSDADGDDGQLMFQSAKPSGCLSQCSIAEAGQSGQPAWELGADGRAYIRAVLSHGPPVGTCKGADSYCQLNKASYELLARHVDAKPRA